MELKMTPLIDVVFLLLVFFVWTASFQAVEKTLPTQLSLVSGASTNPLDVPDPEQDFDDVVIRVRWMGGKVSWQINEDPQPLASAELLDVRLRSISQIKNDVPVIVDPEGEVPWEEVIRVYDMAQLAGFQKVGFAVAEGS